MPDALSLDEWLDERPPAGVELESIDHEADPDAGLPAGTESRWRVTDDSGADWVLRKMKAALEARAVHEATASEAIERVTAWLAEVSAPLDRDVAHWSGVLEDYSRRVLDAKLEAVGGEWEKVKPKGIKLPHGSIDVRRSPGKHETVDAEAAAGALVGWGAMSLLYYAPPTVRATELAAGRDSGEVRISAAGDYEVAVPLALPLNDEDRARLAAAQPGEFLVIDGDLDAAVPAVYEWRRIPGVRRVEIGTISHTPKVGR
jgi:hypothetical protein